MRNVVSSLAVASSLLFAPAASADCESATMVAVDVWKEYGKYAGAQANAAAETAKKMVEFWNKQAGNGWAKVGPRQLEFGQTAKGTVESVGDRAFISAYPANGPVTVEFTKLDGEGTAKVTVCKIDKGGKGTVVKEFTVDKDDKDGKKWDVAVADAKDHVLSVIIDGKKVTRKVAYTLTTK